jgi:hypothetical protein
MQSYRFLEIYTRLNEFHRTLVKENKRDKKAPLQSKDLVRMGVPVLLLRFYLPAKMVSKVVPLYLNTKQVIVKL